MAVSGDTITWLGDADAGRARYPDAELVDVGGAFVAPAFVDAHVHATSSGLLLDGLDLTGCRSLVDCLFAVRVFVAGRAPAGVVWGHGWDETRWPEGRPPTRAELDDAASGAPVYLSRVDVHSALVTSSLALLVPRAWNTPGWSARGPVSQEAHHHIRGAARAALSPAQRRAAQRAFLHHAAARGVAAVHECAGPDISGRDDLTDLLATTNAPEIVGYWGERADPALAAELGVRGLAGDLFADGAIGSRTAALTEPYTDDPTNHGAAYLSAADIAEHVIACTGAGVQAGFHVIGDAAVAAVVEGFATAARAVGAPALVAAGHRVEHLEMVTAEQAARLGAWGVVGSVQPAFDAAWGGTDGMYAKRLGGRRGTALNPFAALIDNGVSLAFGSDSPVTPVDPWGAIRAAVHHRTGGFGISPHAAFTAHTTGGWRAAGNPEPGTLTVGAPATYAVWDTGEQVADMPGLPSVAPGAALPVCLRTVLRGRVIFDGGAVGS
ncbi:MAG TPA: amidohydrolase family protein [Pseudonocardiaceae bacterium]|nr:amidohydrolase family protein [Pseudonocardiaceae bacterium]